MRTSRDRAFLPPHYTVNTTYPLPFQLNKIWLTWTWWHLDGWVASGSWYPFRWHPWPFWRPLPPHSVCRGKQPPGPRCPTIASLWYFQKGSPSHLKHYIKFDSNSQLSMHFNAVIPIHVLFMGIGIFFLFLWLQERGRPNAFLLFIKRYFQ